MISTIWELGSYCVKNQTITIENTGGPGGGRGGDGEYSTVSRRARIMNWDPRNNNC